MISQQGDVKLYQTYNDGDIDVKNGVVSMSSDLETAIYVSLFGGNENDDCSQKSTISWWGNLMEKNDTARQYRSKTQYVLRSLPFSTTNFRKLDDAIKTDLSWILKQKIASELKITLKIGFNKINIVIDITIERKNTQFIFSEIWRAL